MIDNLPSSIMGWRSSVPFVLAVSLYTHCFSIGAVKGLKPCHVRSPHCLSSSQQDEIYACASRGHFRHPHSVFRYYKCHGVGHAACDCRCRYEHMCFDAASRRCQFAFLAEYHNCSDLPSTTATSAPLITPPSGDHHKQSPLPEGTLQGGRVVDSKTYDLKYRFNTKHNDKQHHPITHAPPSAPPKKKVVPRPHRSRAQSFNFARKDILTAQEVLLAENGINAQLVDDVSIFPAWAVAVVVLCVVMLLVMMVIFLY